MYLIKYACVYIHAYKCLYMREPNDYNGKRDEREESGKFFYKIVALPVKQYSII